jgi:hypothetical protein
LFKGKVYRLSGCLVALGYLLLLPALIVDLALLAITAQAIFFHAYRQEAPTTKPAIVVPDGELKGEPQPVVVLPNEQVVFITAWVLTVGWYYVGCPGLVAILVGLLLTMKKKALICDQCGVLNGEWG